MGVFSYHQHFRGDYHCDREHWVVLDWERAGVVVSCDDVVFVKPLMANEMVEEDEEVSAYIEAHV